MLFFFGYGSKRRQVGAGGVHTCPRCHNTTQWARMRQYNQLTVFFVPVLRWKRVTVEQCGICGQTAAA